MKIVFDIEATQPMGASKFHGGGKYGEIVFKSLVTKTDSIAVYYDDSRYINPELLDIIKERKLTVYLKKECSIIDALRKEGNVLYTPLLQYRHLKFPSDITIIGTMHGARAVELPFDEMQYVYLSSIKEKLKTWYKRITNYDFKAQSQFIKEAFSRPNFHVITVSKHSKNIFKCFLNGKGNDIKVFYSPSTVNEDLNNTVAPYSNEKYYLLVSGNRWEKNSYRALKCFDELMQSDPTFKGKVYVTGADPNSPVAKHFAHQERIQFLGYVDNKTLASLYKGAYLLCYPSLNEGFGYPPLEAMSCDTPVIASAMSAIPEVCGDAAFYFNPLCLLEIKARILAMDENEVYAKYKSLTKVRFQYIKKKEDADLEKVSEYISSFVSSPYTEPVSIK